MMGSFQLGGLWPEWLILVVTIVLTILAWWLYFRESRVLNGSARWLLPTLRSTAIGLALLMLAEPSCHRRWYEGTPAHLDIVLDLSQSMSVDDNTDDNRSEPRLKQVDQVLLAGDRPLLERWSETHTVQISTLVDGQLRPVWRSGLEHVDPLPSSVMEWQTNWGTTTQLGAAIQQWLQKQPPASATNNNLRAAYSLLLFTDGQNQGGPEVADFLPTLKETRQRIHSVGIGPLVENRDLAVEGIEVPKTAYAADTVRGQIRILDRYQPSDDQPPATTQLQITPRWPAGSASQPAGVVSAPLWSTEFEPDGSGLRSFNFSFPIKPFVDSLREQWRDIEFTQLPLTFDVTCLPQNGEHSERNNRAAFTLSVQTRRQRVLLLAGRSRWEMQFLRNSLQRDPNWEVDAFLLENGEVRPFGQARQERELPESYEQWTTYDLLVLGEVSPDALPESIQRSISRWVRATGGGLVVVDGQRQTWNQPGLQTLRQLLPVELIASRTPMAPLAVSITNYGQSLGVTQLEERLEDSNQLWNQLPGMRRVTETEVLPGGQVVAELTTGSATFPYLVTRRFGAGRVLYAAGDESWRWRYDAEDRYHQRFWNQVARWIMRRPFMVESEWVALDSQQVFHRPDQSIPLRIRLKGLDGQPASLDTIQGLLQMDQETDAPDERHNEAERLIQLLPVEDYPGVYETQVSGLQPGRYTFQAQVPGYQQGMLSARLQLVVEGLPNHEWLDLTCNSPWLRQLSGSTGGQFVTLNETEKLARQISDSQNGKFMESDTLLWQSYWWFLPIVALLGYEWWLRKQVGLL